MAELTVNTIDRDGATADVDSLLVDAGNAGDAWDASGGAFLVAYNGGAGTKTITLGFADSLDIDGQNTANGGVVNKTVDIDLGKYAFIGPFNTNSDYLDSDGFVRVTYDNAADLKVGAFVTATS